MSEGVQKETKQNIIVEEKKTNLHLFVLVMQWHGAFDATFPFQPVSQQQIKPTNQ